MGVKTEELTKLSHTITRTHSYKGTRAREI